MTQSPRKMNPLNLGLRAVLEISALMAIGLWAWGRGSWVSALVTILALSMVWGIFNVKGDPSRSGNAPVPVSGLFRLMLELAIFATAFFCLGIMGYVGLSRQFGLLLILHYLVSWRRVLWLLNRRGRHDPEADNGRGEL